MNLNGHILEYFDDEHIYLVDGIIVPSITHIMKARFGRKYDGINTDVLKQAAERGTAIHEAIQRLVEDGEETDIPEVRNFKFLARAYGFAVLRTEIPVILFHQGRPIAAGRFDLELTNGEKVGGADIKTTSTLDREYLALQLNLYRRANFQTYGIKWEFLKGIHLRGDTRKYVDIPINDQLTTEFIEQWLKEQKGTEQ